MVGDKTTEDRHPHCNKPLPPNMCHAQSLPCTLYPLLLFCNLTWRMIVSRPVTRLPSPGRLGGSRPLPPSVPIYDRAERNIFLKMQMADPLLRAPDVSRRRRRMASGTEFGKGKESVKESGAGSEMLEDKDKITIRALETAGESTTGAQRKEKDDTKGDSASHDADHLMKERGSDSQQ